MRLIDAEQFRGKHEVAEVNGKLCSVILYADIVNAPTIAVADIGDCTKCKHAHKTGWHEWECDALTYNIDTKDCWEPRRNDNAAG